MKPFSVKYKKAWVKLDKHSLASLLVAVLFVDDGNLHVPNGEIIDKKGSMQEMRDIYNEHNNGNTPPPTQKM